MLKIRYIKATEQVTGWNGDPSQHKYLKVRIGRGEAVVILDIPIPNKPLNALLYDEATQSLVPNPAYVEPEPPRDLAAEIDTLKAEIEILKKS